MLRKPISAFCKLEVEGWYSFPDPTIESKEEEKFNCNFVNPDLGMQIICTVVDHNVLNCIYVSIAPIRSLRKDLTDEDHDQLIVKKSVEILYTFFGDRIFTRQPIIDARNKHHKRFVSILRVDENENDPM